MTSWHNIQDALLQYLLVASVAAAVLPTAVWVGIRFARVQAAVHRHMLWLWCLVGIAAVPPLWLYGPKLSLAVLPAHPAGAVQPTPFDTEMPLATAAPVAVPVVVLPATAQGPVSREAGPALWRTLLLGAWLCGMVLMLARLALGWFQLRRMLAGAEPLMNTREISFEGGSRVRMLLSDAVAGPVCFGLWRPVILLPRSGYLQADAQERRMVLRHELAHVERGDARVNLFQRLVEGVLFFHPGVWLASRQLTQDRELICDNHVLADGTAPNAYARILARVAESGITGHAHAAALFEGRLLGRVKRLLEPRGVRLTHPSRGVWVACTVVALTVFAGFGLVRLDAQPAATGAVDGMPAGLPPGAVVESRDQAPATAPAPVRGEAFDAWRHIRDAHAVTAPASRQGNALEVLSHVRTERAPGPPDREHGNLLLTGTVHAAQEVVIYARTSGYVAKCLVDMGDSVKASDLLVQISAPELDQQVEQAQAQLDQAQANLEQQKVNLESARRTLERAQKLKDQKLGTDQSLELCASAYGTAQANSKAAEAAVKASKANLKQQLQLQRFTNVYAPFGGVITQRSIDVGALVTGGSSSNGTPLLRLSQLDTLRVSVNVPQKDMALVRVGQDAAVLAEEFPGRIFKGKVARTASVLHYEPMEKTMTLLTQVDVPNPERVLLPGMWVKVKIEAATSSVETPDAAPVSRSAADPAGESEIP